MWCTVLQPLVAKLFIVVNSPKVILRLWNRHDISGLGLPVAEQAISALLPASNVTLVSSLLNSMSSADNNQKL